MDYDTWKLMTPEEDAKETYCNIEAVVGVWFTSDEYKEISINLEIAVEEDYYEKSVEPVDLIDSVAEYMKQEYQGCEYDLLNWKFIKDEKF